MFDLPRQAPAHLCSDGVPGLARCLVSGRRRMSSDPGWPAAGLPGLFTAALIGLCPGLFDGLFTALSRGLWTGLCGGLACSPLERPLCGSPAPPNSATPPTGPAERRLAAPPSCCSIEAARAERPPDWGRPGRLLGAASGASSSGETLSWRERCIVSADVGVVFGCGTARSDGLMSSVTDLVPSPAGFCGESALSGGRSAEGGTLSVRLSSLLVLPAEDGAPAALRPAPAPVAGWKRSSSSLSESNRLTAAAAADLSCAADGAEGVIAAFRGASGSAGGATEAAAVGAGAEAAGAGAETGVSGGT